MKKFTIIYPGIGRLTNHVLVAMLIDFETCALFAHNFKGQ